MPPFDALGASLAAALVLGIAAVLRPRRWSAGTALVPLALAAYNAGEGSVIEHANTIPPFAETQDFVRRVQMVYALYRPLPTASPAPVRLPKLQRNPIKERPR